MKTCVYVKLHTSLSSPSSSTSHTGLLLVIDEILMTIELFWLPRWSLMVSSLVFMVIKKVMMPLGMMLTGDNTTSLHSESSEMEKQPWSPLD